MIQIGCAWRNLVVRVAEFLLIAALLAFGGLGIGYSVAQAQAPKTYHVAANANEGLVAYFKFDEGSGAVTRSFPNATITATLQSGASFNPALPGGFSAQNFASLDLTGNTGTNNVDIFDNATTGPFLNSLTGPLTVAVWARRSRLDGGLDSIYVSGSNADAWNFVITADHRLAFRIGVGNPATTYSTTLASAAMISTTTWHHFAATFSSGTLRLYIDGQENATYTGITGSALLTGTKAIGSNIDDSGRFPGQLDELRLYNRALAQAEIQRIAAVGCALDGLSWANAFVDLQCALAVDGSGDTVKVARNFFTPGTSRDASFHLAAGVHYLGNFNTDDTRVSFSPQAILLGFAQPTVLDGDLLGDDFVGVGMTGDNARHVVTAGYNGGGTLLDRFVIQAGRADAGQVQGGGLQISNTAELTIQDVLFQRNAADPVGLGDETGLGGAVYNAGDLALTNVWFDNNAAVLSGGALYVDKGATLIMNGGRVQNNRANSGGGLMFEPGAGQNRLTDVEFVANQAIGVGGAIFARHDLALQGGRFEANNCASGNGGAIAMEGTLVITATGFLSNTAGGAFGGAIAYQDGGALFVTGSRFQGNTAVLVGGAIGSDFADLHLRNSEFVNNAAGDAFFGGGGALYMEGINESVNLTGTMFVTDTVFSGNTTTGDGGAILANQLRMSGGSFTNNGARRGGGLATIDNGALIDLIGVTLTANRSLTTTLSETFDAQLGGGIYVSGTLVMTGSLFTGNQAIVHCGPGESIDNDTCSNAAGGGIFADDDSRVTLTNVDFINNTADDHGDDGGAIHMGRDGTLTYNGGRVEGSRANFSAGVSLQAADATIAGVEFIRNVAFDDPAGGLGAFESQLVLRDVSFIENRLIENDAGAGLFLDFGAQATLDRVLFQGNGQTALVITEPTTRVTATNLQMVGNHWATPPADPNFVADAILVGGAHVTVVNATLAGHTQGALPMVRVTNSGHLTLTNSILWDKADVVATNGGAFTLLNSISGEPGSGVDPRFARYPSPVDGLWSTLGDNDYGDLRLMTDSPAIDKGDGSQLPTGITLDFLENARVFDVNFVANAFAAPVDQGAFEAPFTAPTANPGGPYVDVQEGQPATLNAGGSVDAAAIAAITAFQWDCTDDGTFDATGVTATCTYGDQGSFTLRLRVTDGDGLSDAKTTTVSVVNVPPDANDDSATTPKNAPVTVDVRANDVDVAADTLTIVSVGAPGHGTVVITADQRIRYTPATDYAGSDSFVYTIDDGDGAAGTATVQITVTETNLEARLYLPILGK